MSEKFVIPIRSSSKKIKKRIASRELQDDRRKRRDALSDNIKVARQDLRPKTSFDSEYWDARADVESKSHQRTILHRQISCDDFSGDSDEWEDSALNHDLHAQERVHQTRERIFKQHADRLRLNENDPDFAKKSERRGFVELFTSSPQGLGIKLAAAGRRSTKLQSALRDDCEKKYKPRPAIGSPLVFCSMTGQYWHQDMVHAAHIFPHKHTQKLMIAIFGEESKGELWKAEDAILMTNTAEQHFDNGRFVIVPDIRDNATTDEIASWNQQEPKAYKIRVIATKTNLKELSQEITLTSDPEKMWKDLDGQKLVFKTDFRPRSRYVNLYGQ